MHDGALAQLDTARHALAECKTVMEAKQIADAAEAARVYLERTNASAETVNRATEIRLLAERQMGEFLKVMPKSKGGAAYHNPDSPRAPKAGSDESGLTTYGDVGVTRTQAFRSQKLADIPEPEFKERIAVAQASGGKLSTAAVLDRPTRRSPEKFNLRDWKRHTATALDMRFRDVPDNDLSAAVEYVTEFIQRYTK